MFCQKCGNKLPEDSEFCQYCGASTIQVTNPKKAAKKKITVYIAFTLGICVIFGVSLYGASEYAYDQGFAEGKKVGHQNGYEQGRSAGYNEGYDTAVEEISDELSFYRNNVCLVTESGTKYHQYGCGHIKGHDIYIYTIRNAEKWGYDPCNDCWNDPYEAFFQEVDRLRKEKHR